MNIVKIAFSPVLSFGLAIARTLALIPISSAWGEEQKETSEEAIVPTEEVVSESEERDRM